MASLRHLPKVESELVRIIQPREAVVLHVAQVTVPSHNQRLRVVGMMPVDGPCRAAEAARPAFKGSGLHGLLDGFVGHYGQRVAFPPAVDAGLHGAVPETLLIAPAVAGFAAVMTPITGSAGVVKGCERFEGAAACT